jgi:hypothetical protein
MPIARKPSWVVTSSCSNIPILANQWLPVEMQRCLWKIRTQNGAALKRGIFEMEDYRWRSTLRAFWQCAAGFAALLALTVIAHTRPDWIANALTAVTGFAFLLTALGAQELWAIKRDPFH